jgi:hypothetical protein
MNEKQRKQRERIQYSLKQIKTYVELCLDEFQDESTDTFYVDQKLGEISRIADISKILVRDYEDLMEEE